MRVAAAHGRLMVAQMTKPDRIIVTGEVLECLRGQTYRVRLSNGHVLLAYTSGRLMRNRIRCLPGDSVELELSPYGLDKARLIYRNKPER
jgi:translation initiation factor IF-1